MSISWSNALVTGASSGIGEAFVRKLAARGTNVVLVARRAERLEELAEEVRKEHGVTADVLTADLSDEAGVAAVEERLKLVDRPVDLLVNNAGFGTRGPFHELDVEKEEEEIRLNVIALVRLTRAALPVMIGRKQGGVVNVSSLGSFQPVPMMATYAATKAFVTSFTESVAEEVRGTGARVVALCPGFTRTEFGDHVGAEAAGVPDFLWMDVDPVVDSALSALDRGQVLAIPGLLNQATVATTRMVPRSVVRRFVGLVSKRAGL